MSGEMANIDQTEYGAQLLDQYGVSTRSITLYELIEMAEAKDKDIEEVEIEMISSVCVYDLMYTTADYEFTPDAEAEVVTAMANFYKTLAYAVSDDYAPNAWKNKNDIDNLIELLVEHSDTYSVEDL